MHDVYTAMAVGLFVAVCLLVAFWHDARAEKAKLTRMLADAAPGVPDPDPATRPRLVSAADRAPADRRQPWT